MTTNRIDPLAVTFTEDDDDLDANPITLPDGTVLDNDAAAEYGQRVADKIADDERKRAGRPSLTGDSKNTPILSARVSPELRADLDAIAADRGVATSALVREALTEYAAAHSPA